MINLAELGKAEIRVCELLASGAQFHVRFFNDQSGTSFEVWREDEVAVTAAEGAALILNVGLTLSAKIAASVSVFNDAEVA